MRVFRAKIAILSLKPGFHDTLLDEGCLHHLVQKEQPELEAIVRQQIIVSTQPLGGTGKGAPFAAATATVIDYTPEMLPVRQQGREGSDTGFAVFYAVE